MKNPHFHLECHDKIINIIAVIDILNIWVQITSTTNQTWLVSCNL